MGPTVAYFLRFTAIFDSDILLLLGSKILLLGWEHTGSIPKVMSL